MGRRPSALATTAGAFGPNSCISGKGKCVAKARSKFDGGLLVPPDPAKGCFEKLEGKQDAGDPETLCATEACYTDNGAIANGVMATGAADPPVNDEDAPTLAALFCIPPTAAVTVNVTAGLPGLGRIELQGHATARP